MPPETLYRFIEMAVPDEPGWYRVRDEWRLCRQDDQDHDWWIDLGGGYSVPLRGPVLKLIPVETCR